MYYNTSSNICIINEYEGAEMLNYQISRIKKTGVSNILLLFSDGMGDQ